MELLTKPKLVPNWKDVLSWAWSVWGMYIVILLELLDAAWPYIELYMPFDQVLVSIITILISIGSIVARITYQGRLRDKV